MKIYIKTLFLLLFTVNIYSMDFSNPKDIIIDTKNEGVINDAMLKNLNLKDEKDPNDEFDDITDEEITNKEKASFIPGRYSPRPQECDTLSSKDIYEKLKTNLHIIYLERIKEQSEQEEIEEGQNNNNKQE